MQRVRAPVTPGRLMAAGGGHALDLVVSCREGNTEMRTIALLLALSATLPGCLAAAVGGVAYVWGKDKEADAEKQKARMDYLTRRRAAGATDEEILAEIKATDPEWYKEIQKAGGELPGPEKPDEANEPAEEKPRESRY